MSTKSVWKSVFLLAALALILSGCTKRADAFKPTQVQVNDWFSSDSRSGALITDAKQAQEWYQMAQDMKADGEKTPEGYSYGLVFRDQSGEEHIFMIASNGVGCFSETQAEQPAPDWLSGGEALYHAAEEAAKAHSG